MPQLRIATTNQCLDLPRGQRLVELCEDDQLPIRVVCRAGACGACKIEVLENPDGLSSPSEAEKAFFNKYPKNSVATRLACQCRVLGDVTIK